MGWHGWRSRGRPEGHSGLHRLRPAGAPDRHVCHASQLDGQDHYRRHQGRSSRTCFAGGLNLYAQDTSWNLSNSFYSNFPSDNHWHTLSLPISSLSGGSFSPAAIRALVVCIYSKSPPASGMPAFTPASVTVYIDNIQLQ